MLKRGWKAKLDFTNPHVIRNEAEYEAVIKLVDELTDVMPEPGSPEDDFLQLLGLLIEAYEAEHVPMPPVPSGPREIVNFLFRQHNLSPQEQAELFGGKSRVSEFFSGKRELSRAQIAALYERFGVSPELLMFENPSLRPAIGRGGAVEA